jgi:hypothetical protein
VRVPAPLNRPLHRRLPAVVAVVTCAALGLGGCSDDPGPSDEGAQQSPSSSPSPSSTVSVPSGVELTDEGSKLSFGDSATVIFEATQRSGTALELTVKAVRKGSLADLKGFILDDSYKRKANYYYADVRVKNVGEGDVGGVAVPLWGVNAANTLLPAVRFTTTFAPCPSKKLPAKFGPGDTFSTCLVYLSPDKGSLEAVSYRPSQEFDPITWTGDIATPKPKPDKKAPAKKSDKAKKKAKKKR